MLGMSDRLFIGKLSVVAYVKDLIYTGLDDMAQEFVEQLGSWGQMLFCNKFGYLPCQQFFSSVW